MVKSRDGGWRIYNRRIDVLLVCTANQCRSPMAEVLLRDLIATHGLQARVISAGLYPSGNPATDDAIRVMAERGLDLQAHRSRQLEPSILTAADLIVTMTREHVREVAVTDLAHLDKTFTLKELVSLGDALGSRREDEPLEAWLGRLGAGRQRSALLGVGHDPDYDVEDPIGTSTARYRDTAAELDELLRQLVDHAWPVDRTASTGRSAQEGRTA
jgi:protein-tyrosine-phosphatase